MTRILTIFFFLFSFQTISFSQNCGPGADNFFSACNICGNGFTGSTAGFSPDNANYSFPCGTIENSQWASFVASSSNVNAQITALSCSSGLGLEMAIYDQNLNLVSSCYSSGGTNLSGGVSASGLNVGQRYLIMIDGFGGDNCGFTLSLVGNAANLPPVPPGPVTNNLGIDREVCVGQEICYSINPVQNASAYDWVVPANGRILFGQGTTSICAVFDTPGGGVVRCTPSNVCFTGLPAVTVSIALPTVPTILPPVFLCSSELPFSFNGVDYDAFGNYAEVFQNSNGCDSIVNFSLIPKVEIPNTINTHLCFGDCFTIGDSCYTDSTTIVIEGANGCDSTIIFNPNYSLDSVTVNGYRDSIFCLDSCTQFMVDATVVGQNIINTWSTNNGTINMTNGLFAEGCGAGDYVLTFTNTVTQNSCSLSINLSETDQPIGTLAFVNKMSGENCVDTEFIFTTTDLPNALTYDWTLPNGTTISTATNELVATQALNGVLCVSASNDCGTSNQVCDTIDIAPFLSPEFSIDSRICMNETATIIYLGNASSTAGYNFSIPRGNIVSGSGTGPYVVQFNNDGNYNVSLNVEGDGCQSSNFTQQIQVDTIIPPPNIACNEGSDFIEFSWKDFGLVDIFDGEVLTGQQSNQTGRLTYLVTGLVPNEAVTVEVTAIDSDNVCGTTSVSTLTCLSNILITDPSNERKSFSSTKLNNSEVEIYPNPVTDNLTIKSKYIVKKVEIYNLTGKSIKVNFNTDNIDISKLQNGIYLIKITTENGITTERIQKI